MLLATANSSVENTTTSVSHGNTFIYTCTHIHTHIRMDARTHVLTGETVYSSCMKGRFSVYSLLKIGLDSR